MTDIVEYIKQFLLRDEELSKYLAYGLEDISADTKICILKSGFFEDSYGKAESMPQLPLCMWHSIPLLYGDFREEIKDGVLYLYADVIASTYFLVSRYEEMVVQGNRDERGRYIGRESLPGRAGFMQRPIVDEYGLQLRELLRQQGMFVAEESPHLNKIYLTHDVDVPWISYSFVIAIKSIVKRLLSNHQITISPLLNYFGIYKWNLCDTFDWLLRQDARVKKEYGDACEDIYFILSKKAGTDFTMSYLEDAKADQLLRRLSGNGATLGLHVSYEAGAQSEQVADEVRRATEHIKKPVTKCRNHYLRLNSFETMRELIKHGITEDFTMMYADLIGFRLGTTRTVRWIDPEKRMLTDLILHPLNIMDCTVYSYMGIPREQAWTSCKEIIDTVYQFGGDLDILIHNNIIKLGNFQWFAETYRQMIEYIVELKQS